MRSMRGLGIMVPLVIFKYAGKQGMIMPLFPFMMAFEDEEALDTWFSQEKEKLDESFSKDILKDRENIPAERAEYSKKLDALLAKYKEEYNNFLTLRHRQDIHELEKKKHDEEWKRFVEQHKEELEDYWALLKEEFSDEKKKYVEKLRKLVKTYHLEYVKVKNKMLRLKIRK